MTTVVKFVQMWIFTLVQCSFISLSITRMVLIFKVDTFFLVFKAMDEKISLFQPTEFNQLEHEKRFKLVFKGLMIVITLCVGLFFVLLHFLEPGSLSKWGAMQTSGVVAAGEDNGIKTMFPLLIVGVFWGLTALVMAISDVFARVGGRNDSKTSQMSAQRMMEINNKYVIIDHTWLWRADHDIGGLVKSSRNYVENGL